MSPEMAEQVTRGRSSSMGDGWMSNITGNLKSAFTNFKSSATTAVDQLEQKLAKIDSPSNSVVDPSLSQPEIDPAEMENISWTIPEKNVNAKERLITFDFSFFILRFLVIINTSEIGV